MQFWSPPLSFCTCRIKHCGPRFWTLFLSLRTYPKIYLKLQCNRSIPNITIFNTKAWQTKHIRTTEGKNIPWEEETMEERELCEERGGERELVWERVSHGERKIGSQKHIWWREKWELCFDGGSRVVRNEEGVERLTVVTQTTQTFQISYRPIFEFGNFLILSIFIKLPNNGVLYFYLSISLHC